MKLASNKKTKHSTIPVRKQNQSPLALAVRASVVGLSMAHGVSQAATIEVDSSADDGGAMGECTLREAIVSANTDVDQLNGCDIGSNSGTDTITFDTLPMGTTITLAGGELFIPLGKDIEINASSVTGGIVVDANGSSRIMYSQFSTVSINNMTFSNGSATYGGGIFTYDSAVSIVDSTISSNTANGGGGIYARTDSVLTLENTTLSGNSAYDGAGILTDNSTLTLMGGMIMNNTADLYGGGIQSFESSVTLQNSTISNNTAGYNGGGIEVFMSPDVSLTNTNLYNNIAGYYGGGIQINNSTASIQNSTISGNQADKGGGIFSVGSIANLDSVTLSANSAITLGGGLYGYSDTVNITNSSIYGSVGVDCFSYNETVVRDDISVIADGTCPPSVDSDFFVIPLENGKVVVIPL